jgi:hypothetical protein
VRHQKIDPPIPVIAPVRGDCRTVAWRFVSALHIKGLHVKGDDCRWLP